ncbi:hypothetical protein GGR57DRAFT_507576 [Xylariaceae sp. FL1272]|nr:hypothetical protein GGR57DRAFT_507576 [Xylariaceae sp. FL1272]
MCCLCNSLYSPDESQLHRRFSMPPPPYSQFSPSESQFSPRSFDEPCHLPESQPKAPTNCNPFSFPANSLHVFGCNDLCPRALELQQLRYGPLQGEWSCSMMPCPRQSLQRIETIILYPKSFELLDGNKFIRRGSDDRGMHNATKTRNASSSHPGLRARMCKKTKTLWRRICGRDLLCVQCAAPINNFKGNHEGIENWQRPMTSRWYTPDDLGQVTHNETYAELPAVAERSELYVDPSAVCAEPSELWSPTGPAHGEPSYQQTQQWAVSGTYSQQPTPSSSLSSTCTNQNGYLSMDVSPTTSDQSRTLYTTGHPMGQSAMAMTNDYPAGTQQLQTGNVQPIYINQHDGLYNTFANFCYSPQSLDADVATHGAFGNTTMSPSSRTFHNNQFGHWHEDTPNTFGSPQNPAEVDGITENDHWAPPNMPTTPDRSNRSRSATSFQAALPQQIPQTPRNTPVTTRNSSTSEDDSVSSPPLPSAPHTTPASSTSPSPDPMAREPVFKCSICGFEPQGKAKNFPAYMRKHNRTHDEHKTTHSCPRCGKTFTRRDNYQTHVRRRHSIIGGNEN